MLRYLLVLVALAATSMVDAKLSLCREALKAGEDDVEIPLDVDAAKAVLDKSRDKLTVLSAMRVRIPSPLISNQPQLSAQSKARVRISSPIILNQPKLSCPRYKTFYWGPQELCPSKRVRVNSFFSINGFCYVLFPLWQNIYESRCLCRNCRLNCKPTNTTFRHTCVRDPKPTVSKKVWAICNKFGSWQLRNFFHNFSLGKCTCKTFYRGRCSG